MDPLKEWEPDFLELVEDEWKLWRGKGDEYTVGNERLFNFTSVAELTGLTPMQVWAVYAAKHFFAICAYAKTGKEGMEGIESRCADLAVYAKLARLIARRDKELAADKMRPLAELAKEVGAEFESTEPASMDEDRHPPSGPHTIPEFPLHPVADLVFRSTASELGYPDIPINERKGF